MSNKLPPIPEESFDGEKYKAELVENRCPHKDVKIISGSELRCKCGAGWHGQGVVTLYNLLTSRG